MSHKKITVTGRCGPRTKEDAAGLLAAFEQVFGVPAKHMTVADEWHGLFAAGVLIPDEVYTFAAPLGDLGARGLGRSSLGVSMAVGSEFSIIG